MEPINQKVDEAVLKCLKSIHAMLAEQQKQMDELREQVISIQKYVVRKQEEEKKL